MKISVLLLLVMTIAMMPFGWIIGCKLIAAIFTGFNREKIFPLDYWCYRSEPYLD